jgi:polyketide cyclase/dehydrase/lipid transport protein
VTLARAAALAGLLATSATPVSAQEPVVTTAPVAGTSIRVVRASADVAAAPETVLAVIDDVASYRSTMPYVAESRVVERTPTSVVSYQRLRFPVPMLDDRDYVIRITAHLEAGTGDAVVHRRIWRLEPTADVPERPGVVRVRVNEGSWIVTAKRADLSHVSYCLYTDPGGGVWKWVANQANVQAIPRLFQALREAVKLPRYDTRRDDALLRPEPAEPGDLVACGHD